MNRGIHGENKDHGGPANQNTTPPYTISNGSVYLFLTGCVGGAGYGARVMPSLRCPGLCCLSRVVWDAASSLVMYHRHWDS